MTKLFKHTAIAFGLNVLSLGLFVLPILIGFFCGGKYAMITGVSISILLAFMSLTCQLIAVYIFWNNDEKRIISKAILLSLGIIFITGIFILLD